MSAHCLFCGHALTPDQAAKWGAYCSKLHYDRELRAVQHLERTSLPDPPELCQQPGCTLAVETWCPLCERFLCLAHDRLVPVRNHDCLSGPADILEAPSHA